MLFGTLGALSLVAFATWALEVHRTLREVLVELRRIREELAARDRR